MMIAPIEWSCDIELLEVTLDRKLEAQELIEIHRFEKYHNDHRYRLARTITEMLWLDTITFEQVLKTIKNK